MKPELDCGVAKHVDLFSQPSSAITAAGSTTRRLAGLFAIRLNGKERNLFTPGRIGRQHGVILFLR
jgi:ribosomal protein L13